LRKRGSAGILSELELQGRRRIDCLSGKLDIRHTPVVGSLSSLVSPATLDEHGGDTIHEYQCMNVLSPPWSSPMA